ncbi:MAG TPA: signal peptidase I [Vicinamibacterales bacterium]|jgi:signal peptidase I|nr:signal peptidase I [Vicinamibacterales bacterium]
MTAPALTSEASIPRRSARASALRFAAAVTSTAALSAFIVRFLVPSALEGSRGGLTGFFGWLGQLHPLVLGVCLFIVLAEIGRYWVRHIGVSGLDAYPSPHARARSIPLRRVGVALALVAAAAFSLRSSVAATYRVVGPSMLPTLEMGDRVLVDRTAYGLRLPFAKHLLSPKTPARGDLVVFSITGLPGTSGPQAVVKRVIGLPGDTVAFERGRIILNGSTVLGCDAGPYVDLASTVTVRGRLVVEYLNDKRYLTVVKPIEQPFPAYTVKPGEVFVIGDDRGMSTDSRVWSEGHGSGVAIDALEGKVTRVLLGARPDGRLDFSRLLAPPLDMKVRIPGVDMALTDKRIGECLAAPPKVAPAPALETAQPQ